MSGAAHPYARVCAASWIPDMLANAPASIAGTDCGAGCTFGALCRVAVADDGSRDSIGDADVGIVVDDADIVVVAATGLPLPHFCVALRLADASAFVAKPMLCIHAM